MSWGICIVADKELTDDMVRAALISYCGKEPPEQLWGWSAGVDVDHPAGKELRISGAYYSAGSGPSFADGIARALRKLYGVSCSIPLGDDE